MVLVDTSVWIRFLAGREPYATGLDELLSRDEVAGHEMVFGELLIGDRGGRTKLLGSYVHMQQSNTIPHNEVVEFVRHDDCSGAVWGGSTFIYWRRPLSDGLSCGRPISNSQPLPQHFGSPSRRATRSLTNDSGIQRWAQPDRCNSGLDGALIDGAR